MLKPGFINSGSSGEGNVMALNLIPINIFVSGYIQPTPHPVCGCVKNHSKKCHRLNCQWIGLRENLQETIDFPIKYGAFL